MSDAVKTEAAERAHIYGLLATVFRRPLDGSQLDHLRTPGLLGALVDAGIDPGEDFAKGEANTLLDCLAIDYTELFHVSADRIVPYEGIQIGKTDQLMGAAAHSVRDFLAQAGYAAPPESGELPDHISVELAFMSELALREAEAAQADDRETAEYAASLQRRFLDEHLGRWAGRFADEVGGAAGTSFYRSMAALLAWLIADEYADRTIQ